MSLPGLLWPLRDARLARWMDRAQRGDREPFRSLYRELYGPVARFVAFRVSGSADAEDLVSQVFFQLLERLSSYQPGRGSVLSYTLSIARNAVVDHLRRKSPAPLAEGAAAEDPGASPLERLVATEGVAAVNQQLGRLSAVDRQLILLRFGDGLRYAEIAQLAQMTVPAVRQRVSRALRGLRENWPDRAEEGALVP